MIRAILINLDNQQYKEGSGDLIAEWQINDTTWIWLDLDSMDPNDESNLLQQDFGIDELAISDAQRKRFPPKFEFFSNHIFVLNLELQDDWTNSAFTTNLVAMFVGPRFFITRRTTVSTAVNEVWSKFTVDPSRYVSNPNFVFLRLARVIVNGYTKLVLEFETKIEEVEEELLERPSDDLLGELSAYKNNVKRLRRVLAYHVNLFDELRSTSEIPLTIDESHLVNDIYEHWERNLNLCALSSELADDLINGYLTIASHRLNNIIRTLTVITAIFLPLTLLAGIYGMNFEYMPELKWRYGYFGLLSIMFMLVFALIGLFKWKKWL